MKQRELTVQTSSKKEVIDITEQVAKDLPTEASMVNIFVTHTTCAVTTVSMDPGLDQDLLDATEKMIPALDYRHGAEHAPSHLISSLIGPSLSVPVAHGELGLGRWQRIVLIELDGPKSRTVKTTFFCD
jgi:secondary thiamine-phosphate synthase enzyme